MSSSTDKNTRGLLEELLAIAVSDLRSARVLYDAGQYRTSYYLFQQSAEKSNKAFGLFQGIISADELLKVQHKQTAIHRKALVGQKGNVDTFTGVLEQLPHLVNHKFVRQIDIDRFETHITDGLSYIDSLYNADLVNLTNNELNDYLRLLRQLECGIAKSLKKRGRIPRRDVESYKDYMLSLADFVGALGTAESAEAKKELEEYIRDEEKVSASLLSLVDEGLPLVAKLAFLSCTFLTCAIVTVQHSSRSRYPDSDGNRPTDIYKKSLPIVRKQPQFMDYLERAQLVFGELLETETVETK
jgi:HEPN domain-containing protein